MFAAACNVHGYCCKCEPCGDANGRRRVADGSGLHDDEFPPERIGYINKIGQRLIARAGNPGKFPIDLYAGPLFSMTYGWFYFSGFPIDFCAGLGCGCGRG